MDQRIRQVHCAGDGTILDVPLPADASVEELQRHLEQATGVPPQEQILINEQGVNLRANQRLGSPRIEAAIFFFNIRDVTATEAPVRPVLNPVLSEVPVGDIGAVAEVFLRRADEMCTIGREASREQQVMSRALGAARANLVGHTSYFTKKFEGFDKDLKATLQRYREVLERCDEHFAHLATVEVPAVLKDQVPGLDTSTHLMDTAPLQQLDSHHKYAAGGLTQMETRIAELRASFGKFAAQVEETSAHGDSVSVGGQHFAELEGTLQELVTIRERQYSNRKALGECSGNEARAAQICEEMAQADTQMHEKMQHALRAKGRLGVEIHSKMQGISDLQTNIRKMGKTTNGYYDSLHSLDRYFVELGHAEHIAEAFRASLAEIQRRRLFKAQYQAELQGMLDSLKAMCDAEVALRDSFWQAHGVHLPSALVPGLEDRPPHVAVELPGFDTALPDLGPLPSTPALTTPHSTQAKSPTPLELPVVGEALAGSSSGLGMRGAVTESAVQSPFSTASVSQQACPPLEMLTSEEDSGVSGSLISSQSETLQPGGASMMESLTEIRLNNAHLETQLEETRAQLSDAEREIDIRVDTIQSLRDIVLGGSEPSNANSLDDSALLEAVRSQTAAAEELQRAQHELEQTKAEAQAWRQRSGARVACDGFEVGDLALFLRGEAQVYEAFNVGCPHHYLQVEGDVTEGSSLLGRVTSKMKVTAAEANNPFGVGAGKEYYILTADLEVDKMR